MKKAGSVLWGIVLIAAGVIWALNEFNVTNINVFTVKSKPGVPKAQKISPQKDNGSIF